MVRGAQVFPALGLIGGFLLLNLGLYYLSGDLKFINPSKLFIDLSFVLTGVTAIFISALYLLRER